MDKFEVAHFFMEAREHIFYSLCNGQDNASRRDDIVAPYN